MTISMIKMQNGKSKNISLNDVKNKLKDIMKERNASPSAFGYLFQVVVGLILALHFINRMTSINIEGSKQDVEVNFNKDVLYCQAKSCSKHNVSNILNTNWRRKLISGLDLLFADYCFFKILNLSDKSPIGFVYAINYPFPLGKEGKKSFGQYDYQNNAMDLTKNERLVIVKYMEKGSWTQFYKKYSIQKYHMLLKSFLAHLFFISYNFVQDRSLPFGALGKRHEYDFLNDEIESFLKNNSLNKQINYSDVTHLWIQMFYDDSTRGAQCVITKKALCTSIYMLDIRQNSPERILGHSIKNKKFDFIKKYKNLIIEYNYDIPFIGKFRHDLNNYKGYLDKNTLSDADINNFVKKRELYYEPYFSVNDNPKEIKALTEFALTDLLEKNNIMRQVIYGDIKDNVD